MQNFFLNGRHTVFTSRAIIFIAALFFLPEISRSQTTHDVFFSPYHGDAPFSLKFTLTGGISSHVFLQRADLGITLPLTYSCANGLGSCYIISECENQTGIPIISLNSHNEEVSIDDAVTLIIPGLGTRIAREGFGCPLWEKISISESPGQIVDTTSTNVWKRSD